MKVILKREFNETELRQIKQHVTGGRSSSKASRKEVLGWAGAELMEALIRLPDPKRRKKLEPSPARIESRDRFAAAREAAPDAICVHCGKTKELGHGKMGYTCMVGGKMFEVAS